MKINVNQNDLCNNKYHNRNVFPYALGKWICFHIHIIFFNIWQNIVLLEWRLTFHGYSRVALKQWILVDYIPCNKQKEIIWLQKTWWNNAGVTDMTAR